MSFYFDPLCQTSLQLSEADAKASQAAGRSDFIPKSWSK